MKKIFVAGFLAMTALSQAAITTFLDSTTPDGGNTAFNYHFEQTTDDVLRTNDFITIYDFAGFVSASAPTDFTFSVQNTGLNPHTNVGPVAPGLDSTAVNVTFKRSGANTQQQSFVGFQIVSTFAASSGVLAFTGQNAKMNFPGSINGSLGQVSGPGSEAPEPASMGLLGLGLSGIAFVARRRRKANQA
jgi:hypothetical protein